MYRKILVPLDGSEAAEKVLQHAEKLAKTFDAEIILFQVIPFRAMNGSMGFVTFPVVNEKEKEAAETYLSNLADEMKKRSYKVMAVVRVSQRVAKEIIEFAKESGVDLITMRSHGRSGIARWFLRSVGQRVLAWAEVSVLFIHSNR
jgi:nucleotide-binding universal stress UspA family protein